MQIDEALRYLGNFGRLQTAVFILYCVAGCAFPAWQMTAMVFIADKPLGYQCIKVPPSAGNDNASHGWYSANISESLHQDDDNSSVVLDDVKECFINDSDTGDQTACTAWDYTFEYGERTAVSDFDLVCDRAVLANTAQSIFFGGVLVGSLVSGALSDLFGRKVVLIVALLLEGAFGIGTAFAPSYTVFVLLWFFVGALEPGINVTGFVLIMEMFSPEKRTLAGCLTGLAWGAGMALITLFAYLLRDWRRMQIAISVPLLVAVPITMWVTFESVRWLMSKGRVQAAEKVLHRIARVNNIQAPDYFFKDNDEVSPVAGHTAVRYQRSDVNDNAGNDETAFNENGHGTVKMDAVERPPGSQDAFRFAELLETPRLFRNTFIMFYSWLVSSMVYYGLFLNSSNLAGNKYLNTFLLGLVEVPGYFVVYPMIEWWGRRPSLSLSHFIAGVSSIICACIPTTPEGGDFTPVILGFALVGRFCATISFSTDYVYGTEIFPTSIRNLGVGSSSFAARIGGIVAPFVVYLADVSPYIPLNVFGIVSVLAAVLVLILPETAKQPLPETLAESEQLARSAAPPRLPSCMWLVGKQRMGGDGYQPASAV